MKAFLPLLALLFLVSAKTPEPGYFAHTSQNKDTLYLLKNDTLSKVIYKIWQVDTLWTSKKPVIKFVSKKQMASIKK